MKTHNILIIRSATRVFNPTLQSLKKEFPNSKITVLAPESVRESLEQDSMIDEVLPLKTGGRMSVFSYGLSRLRELRERNFDLAVALYNIEQGRGYSNIDMLAAASGARQVRGYNSKGTYVDLSGVGIFKKFLRERMSGAWVVINCLATVVLFFTITLGLVAEWCYRKLFAGGESPSPAEPDRNP